METENIALIDLDGTIADYDKAMSMELKSMQSPYEPNTIYEFAKDTEPDWLKKRIRTIRQRPGFWRDLETIPIGLTILHILRETGYSLNILTKGPESSPNAWSEKFEWTRKHVPDAQVTVSENKGRTYGRILYDDWPDYILSWLEWRPRGLVLMNDHRWNRDFSHPQVLRVTDFEQVRTVVRKALRIHANRAMSPSELVTYSQGSTDT